MPVAFADRMPTEREVERLRLLLSTYQDGTGMLNLKGTATTLPGWRDFERAVALAWGGQAQESKAVFDVLLHDKVRNVDYGISCKMRDTLRETERTKQVTIEVSNSSGYFWTALAQQGIQEDNYARYPAKTGQVIIELVHSWHDAVSLANGGTVDLSKSYYLVLQWDSKSGRYQLYQHLLRFPAPADLEWDLAGRRVIAHDKDGNKLLEWYGKSGGQLKYYPYCTDAVWTSVVFKLEPLPNNNDEYGVKHKAAAYFPDRWHWASSDS